MREKPVPAQRPTIFPADPHMQEKTLCFLPSFFTCVTTSTAMTSNALDKAE